MADATSLTPPSPGLSATKFPNKVLNPTVPKKQNCLNKIEHYIGVRGYFRAATRQNDSCFDL